MQLGPDRDGLWMFIGLWLASSNGFPLWGINGHRTSQCLCLPSRLGQAQPNTKLMIRLCKRKWRCTSSEPVSPTPEEGKKKCIWLKNIPLYVYIRTRLSVYPEWSINSPSVCEGRRLFSFSVPLVSMSDGGNQELSAIICRQLSKYFLKVQSIGSKITR